MKSLGIFAALFVGTILLFVVFGAVAGGSTGSGVGFLLAILVVPYFLPAIIGYSRRHPSCHAILALNLLLGWTLVGWIISIVWSLKNSVPKVQVIIARNDTVSFESKPLSKDIEKQSLYD